MINKEISCNSCKYFINNMSCSKYRKINEKIRNGETICNEYNLQLNVCMDAVVGFAIGDAMGVPVEFKSREYLTRYPITEFIGYGTYNQPAGIWSDDTSLLIATIYGLKDASDIYGIANEMCNWYKYKKYTPLGKIFDVGLTTRKSILKMINGVDPLSAGSKSENKNGNGSLMRILPIAFILKDEQDIEKRKEFVYNVSSLTHANIISKIACHIYTEFVIQLLHHKSKEKAYDYIYTTLATYYKNNIDKNIYNKFENIFDKTLLSMSRDKIKSTTFVIDTLESCFWSIFNSHSFEEAILTAVNLGDDTDTIGALTGGLAGIIYGYEKIPNEWKHGLMNELMITNAANTLYEKTYNLDKYLFHHFIVKYGKTRDDARKTLFYLKEYKDIYNEYLTHLRTSSFLDENAIVVENYTAEMIKKITNLSDVGAYSYLIYLRKDPKNAKKYLNILKERQK